MLDTDHHGLRSLADDLLGGSAELRRRVGRNAQRNETQTGASRLGRCPEDLVRRSALVQQDGDAPGRRNGLMQDFDPLAQHFGGLGGHASDVAPRPGQARDKPEAYGIPDADEHDRYRLRGFLRREGGQDIRGHDDVDLLLDQISGQRVESVEVGTGRSDPVLDVAAFDPPEVAHPLLEGVPEMAADGRRRCAQISDTPHRRSRLRVADAMRAQQGHRSRQQNSARRKH